MDTKDEAERAADPRLPAIPDSHGHAKGEHKPYAEERPIPYTARMLFLWFFHACRRGSPRFMMVADHMNYLTFEDPAAVNLVRRALKLAQAGDLFGAAETAGVEVGHAEVVSKGLRRGMRYSIGAEVDNDPRSRPDAQNIVDAMKPDGMIRSVHFLPITHPAHGENWMWAFDNPEFKDLYDVVGTETVWEIYMATLLDAVEKLPGHIVGHFYVPAVFGHWPDDAVLEGYEDKLVDACAERGMAIEINSRYVYKHYAGDEAQLERFRAAYVRLLGKAKEKNVEIAVGSDAHSPKDQGRAFDAVLAILDEVGINEIAFPIGGRLARVALRATEEIMKQYAPPEPEPVPVAAAAAPEAPETPAADEPPAKVKKPRPSRSKAALAAAAAAASAAAAEAGDTEPPAAVAVDEGEAGDSAETVLAAAEGQDGAPAAEPEPPALPELEPEPEPAAAEAPHHEEPVHETPASEPELAAEPEPTPMDGPVHEHVEAREAEHVAAAGHEPVAHEPSAHEPAAHAREHAPAAPKRSTPRKKAESAAPHAEGGSALDRLVDAAKNTISAVVEALTPGHDAAHHDEAAEKPAKPVKTPAVKAAPKVADKPASAKTAAAKAAPAKKAAPTKPAPKPPAKPAAKAAPAKKGAAKKTAAKKAAPKKAASAKKAASKPAAKKSTNAKKAPAKKAAIKKAAPKKAASAKKSVAKKSPPKTVKRSAAKKSTAKKSPAKKPARRR